MDCPFLRTVLDWCLGIALVATIGLISPVEIYAEDQEADESPSEHEGSAEEHGAAHHHKNHFAVFVGTTEAEEHQGEQGDPDFTIGFDYERRINDWFGAGALADFVVEGRREYLLGPLFIFHAGKSAKFFAAPCYQKVRETGHHNLVFRTGFAWDFFFGKYSVFPAIYYDFTEEQNFLVLGVGFGLGF